MTNATSNSFAQDVLASHGPVLVDFYTPDCGPCRAMSPVLDEIARERGEGLKIVKVDAAENPQLAAQFRVTAMPTFILFKDGLPQKQIVGARSKKLFTAWIDSSN